MLLLLRPERTAKEAKRSRGKTKSRWRGEPPRPPRTPRRGKEGGIGHRGTESTERNGSEVKARRPSP
jgi:hypothetical protein